MLRTRSVPKLLLRLVMLQALVLSSLPLSGASATSVAAPAEAPLAAPSTCGASDPGTCNVTIDVRDFPTGDPLDNFNYIINVDNTKLPDDPLALDTESNSPIVRTGDQDRATVTLPNGRYLVSARSLDHKMWGAYFTLPNDATGSGSSGSLTVQISLTVQSAINPLPLGKIRVFAFEDNAWANGAPDTEEGGVGGFQVTLDEQTDNAVTVDYFNNPICTTYQLNPDGTFADSDGDGLPDVLNPGGNCYTGSDGFVQVDNLGPATYFIHVTPPEGPCNDDPDSRWFQTTTIDGGLTLWAPTEEGADGTGAPGEQLWEPPNNRTAYWFGFVCEPQPFANPGTGEIVGAARNWVEWAPYTTGTWTDPVEEPFVALSDAATDQTVFIGRGDAEGNFDIQGVPAGTYNLAIWDEQLSYIMRFKPVTVADGETVDVNDVDDVGNVGLGVSRWFGWLDGYVYKDVDGDGKYTDGVDTPIGNTDVDQRWRDGSIKEGTFTDPNGYYVYPTAEGGALGRWIVGEQGFARFSAYPGASYHDERNPNLVTPSCVTVDPVTGDPVPPANPCIPNSEGGGLLVNNLLLEGHRSTVDWGKRDYDPGEPGQIVGITYWATTRNEFFAPLQAHEDYEPAVPDVTVLLETPGPDGEPNTDDDIVVNSYVTDHWVQPNAGEDPQDPPGNTFTQDCNPIRDLAGNDISDQFNPNIGPECLEVPLTGIQTKDGKFDGGYAFADYCPGGYDLEADDGTCIGGGDPVPLVAGDYIVHVIMPKDSTDTRDCNPTGETQRISEAHGAVPGGGTGCLYHVVREEDVNVDLGNNYAPQIPPPPCNGDMHVIDQSTLTPRSPYFTGDQNTSASAPLCDKHLVVLQNGQNANADFNMMTNFRTDPNGEDPNDTRTGDVQEPGRLVGQVFNDIYFERDPMSPWYGEPRPIGGIPIGIYARVDSACPANDPLVNPCDPDSANVNAPFDANNWRLLTTVTTSPDGSFEVLVPSTETLNCPIPQGPCPGMYLVTVDDPGRTDHPNPNFNPNLLVATTPADAWPGLTTQLDLPLDPISGTACEDPAGAAGGIAPDPSDPARPELLQVSTPVITGSAGPTSRRITIFGDFIGIQGPTGANGGRITLTDVRTGAVTTLTRGGSLSGTNGGIVSWTQGSGSTPDTIVVQIPGATGSFPPGPKQLTIVTANNNPGGGGVLSVNGITVHVLGAVGSVSYTPTVVNVPPPPPPPTNDPHALQNAIDAAAPGSLLVLSAGTYNENVLVWKPLKIQGLGPGGIIGAHEFQARDPEDPRFNVKGSIIDGRYFAQNATSYDGVVSAHAPYALADAPLNVVLRGADLTVVAQSVSAYNISGATGIFNAARIDGLGLMTGRGEGAGGLQLMANINNMQITNNILENNGGVFAGGIGLGQIYARHSHNYNVRIANDRLIGNGGLTTSGGLGIFYDSNNYEVANSIICSNFSVEYGAGISHIGLSPNGNIHDNRIYYNESVDSGAGIAIESELPIGGGLGDGSGAVNVDRNLIQSNFSTLDDGGGIFLLNALDQPINIRNNMIVDNGAADLGGAILLDDSSRVAIINNTIANNVTTGSSENSDGLPHGAGLTSEANEPAWQTDSRYAAQYPNASTRPDFSNPAALFNNIFWNNDALTLDSFGPGATLVDNGFIDFEVYGTTNNADTFTPRYSDLTNGLILGPDGVLRPVPAGQGNTSGDPGFVAPFINELAVSGSRLDPQQAAVTITGQDPPVGLTGDYHLTPPTGIAANTASAVIDRGVRCALTPFPAPANALGACTLTPPTGGRGAEAPFVDIDGQLRPQLRTFRVRTPWDLGADEVPMFATAASGFATAAVLDNFNRSTPLRSNGVLLGANWAGLPIVQSGGYLPYRIRGGKVQVRTTGALGPAIWNGPGAVFGSNQTAFFTFTDVSGSAAGQSLILKVTGLDGLAPGLTIGVNTAMIEVGYSAPTHEVQVKTYCGSAVAGCGSQGWQTRATFSGVTFVNGDTFSAMAGDDGTVLAYRNGALIGDAEVTEGPSLWPAANAAGGGRIGVWFFGTGNNTGSTGSGQNARFDNFGGGTLP